MVKRLKALGLDDSYTEQPLNTYDEILKTYPGEWVNVHVMARVSSIGTMSLLVMTHRY